jgi:hypothetical protein
MLYATPNNKEFENTLNLLIQKKLVFIVDDKKLYD